RNLSIKVEECLEPLSQVSGIENLDAAILKDYAEEFKYGETHLSKLDELLKDSVPNDDMVYPSKCDGIITRNKAEFIEKAQYLQALRAKLYSASPELIQLRNFAME